MFTPVVELRWNLTSVSVSNCLLSEPSCTGVFLFIWINLYQISLQQLSNNINLNIIRAYQTSTQWPTYLSIR